MSHIIWVILYESYCSGLNPEKKIEKKEDEFDFKDKCTELYIHRPAASDAIAFIRMIAYNQGKNDVTVTSRWRYF